MTLRTGLGRQARTGVTCPRCGADLLAHRGCLATIISCAGQCQGAFELSDLVNELDEQSFARLAEAVGDHLADRV